MSLEQKIDKLIENVVLLTGKVEQRAKVNEHSNAQASQSITQAGKTVSNATHDIQRITSQTVGSAILKPVDELDQALLVLGLGAQSNHGLIATRSGAV